MRGLIGHPAPKPLDLKLLGLHLAMARKRLLRISGKLPNPFAQHILVKVEITGRPGYRHTPSLDQFHCLKLELAGELFSASNTPGSIRPP